MGHSHFWGNIRPRVRRPFVVLISPKAGVTTTPCVYGAREAQDTTVLVMDNGDLVGKVLPLLERRAERNILKHKDRYIAIGRGARRTRPMVLQVGGLDGGGLLGV